MTKQRRLVIGGGVLTAPFLLVMAEMLGVSVVDAILGIGVGWFEFALATVLMATLGRELAIESADITLRGYDPYEDYRLLGFLR